MSLPENAHLLIFPAVLLLLILAILGLAEFRAVDYCRDRRRRMSP